MHVAIVFIDDKVCHLEEIVTIFAEAALNLYRRFRAPFTYGAGQNTADK